jgi:hypothetical protein
VFSTIKRAVLLAVAAAITLSACGASSDKPSAASAPPTGSSSGPSTGSPTTGDAGTLAPGDESSGQGCAAIKPATVHALITGPVGSPFNGNLAGGPDFTCYYGIGPNATKDGVALETADPDVFIVSRTGADGTAKYNNTVSVAAGQNPDSVVPLAGVGDQASYIYLKASGEPPTVQALSKGVYCSVELSLTNASEVGITQADPDQPTVISATDAATLAQKMGALCTDALD